MLTKLEQGVIYEIDNSMYKSGDPKPRWRVRIEAAAETGDPAADNNVHVITAGAAVSDFDRSVPTDHTRINTMKFILTLEEALARQSEKPDSDQLPMLASDLMVPLEYETLSRIMCPSCGEYDWEVGMQAALTPNDKLNWPYPTPAGDRLSCECKMCGHALTVTFWFSE